MDRFLIAARLVHYASTISLAGQFAFLCCVADPDGTGRLRRRILLLAWGSLLLALISGAAWLLAVAAAMSGTPVDAVLSQGVVAIVLTRTRFGQIWLIRLALAVLVAICLLARHRWRAPAWRWAGLGLSAGLLATLAWAGHGGATPGRPGDLHLAADMLHLLAAGAWLGSLIPLALLLAEARRSSDPGAGAAAWRVVVRFSILAATSVAILLAAGLVNTWFLAGTVPALIGTEYGRLLLSKITIFITMVIFGAVNLLRMTPRLAPAAGERRPLIQAALGHLRRNALVEAGLGLCVLCIVAVLGILPPGLHTEPGWPLPFRLELGALAPVSQVLLAILAALVGVFVIAGVATAAAGRYRIMSVAWAGLALCLCLGWIGLRPAIEPAYPTSFYAPAEPYAAASVVHGARLYAENCAVCHGADGRGNGPAAAGLSVRPADLTAPHLFAHTPGDLFWWVSHGKGNGVMPGFGGVMSPAERWDVINFIRARAAGVLSRRVGAEVSTAAAPAIPDFAFESGAGQQTLSVVLESGPALLALVAGPPAASRVAQLAAAQRRVAGGLRILAIDLGSAAPPPETETRSPLVGISPEVATTLALFRAPDDGGETDLMLDRAANLRARWTRSGPGGLPTAEALIAAAARVARFPAAPASHAGHAH
jgi:putative copper export protein/mono/diheme cytochrome c family protein